MGVAQLLLVRHGESTANVAREQAESDGDEIIPVQCRDADVPLSDVGRAQAQALGRWLASTPGDVAPTSAWCSPYVRARETAVVALQRWGRNTPLRVDERLRDKELGVLDTLTMTGVRNRFPGEAQRRKWLGKFYYRAPGGESWADLALRIRSAMVDLDRTENDKKVVVFTHDAMVMLFRYVCEGMDEATLMELCRSTEIVNTSITRLVREGSDGPWRVAEFNSTPHLSEQLRTEHGARAPDSSGAGAPDSSGAGAPDSSGAGAPYWSGAAAPDATVVGAPQASPR